MWRVNPFNGIAVFKLTLAKTVFEHNKFVRQRNLMLAPDDSVSVGGNIRSRIFTHDFIY
jgi:hypothetical protein